IDRRIAVVALQPLPGATQGQILVRGQPPAPLSAITRRVVGEPGPGLKLIAAQLGPRFQLCIHSATLPRPPTAAPVSAAPEQGANGADEPGCLWPKEYPDLVPVSTWSPGSWGSSTAGCYFSTKARSMT